MSTSSSPDNVSDHSQSSHRPTHGKSPTGASHKAKGTHPWMALVNPGPWTWLPPAAAPSPPPRPGPDPSAPVGWFRPRVTPCNPFGKVDSNDEAGKESTKAGKEATKAGKEATEAGKEATKAGKEATKAGKESTEAGKEATEAGKESTEAGKESTEAGKESTEAGKEATEAGKESTEAGKESTEAGKEATEAGKESTEAGKESTEAGKESTEAGKESTEAGKESTKAGKESTEAGKEATKAGKESTEAGKESTEAGKESTKAGKEATEAGKESTEAGKEATKAGKEATEAGKESTEAGKEATKAGKEATKAGKEATEAGKEATKADVDQSKPSEQTGQSEDGSGSMHGLPRNTAVVTSAEGKAIPSDEPNPSEKPPSSILEPAQRDSSAAPPRSSSMGGSGRGSPSLGEAGSPGSETGSADLAAGVLGAPLLAAAAATSVHASNVPEAGGLHGLAVGGSLSALAEGATANPRSLLAAGATGGGKDAPGGLGLPDLPDSLSSLGSHVGSPDLAACGGLGSLAVVASGVPAVPAGASDSGEGDAARGSTETGTRFDRGSPTQSEAGKDDPLPPKAAVPKSKTFQASPSRRAPAPGYGFPPIKRKVRTDARVPTDDLQGEMGEVNMRLEALELRGAHLEKSLRDSKNKKEEEATMTDWMAVIHEKQLVVRRHTELVYLTKQKNLEERQADLEYELRCLLIRPESEWRAEDRAREQQMMEELVGVIEQRNQIISSLDRDRQSEKEEDAVLEVMQKKGFQKEVLKELKKSKGKFKPMKVFRMLSAKGEQGHE